MYIKTKLLLLLTYFLICFNVFAQSSKGKPNVIFIVCDDLNDTEGFMEGQLKGLTPNMDKLASMGVQFTHAYANIPICGPSRASFLNGLQSYTTGYYGYDMQKNSWLMNSKLKSSFTFMEHFTNNGYDVYGTGKIFHNGQDKPNVWVRPDGFDGRGAVPDLGPFPWAGVPEKGSKAWAAHPDMPEPLRHHWEDSFGSLSKIPNWPADSLKNIPGHNGWMLAGKPFKYIDDNNRDLMPDELSVNFDDKLLKQKHEKPFLIALGFNKPHTPLYAPKEYFDRFPLDKIKLPAKLESDLEDCSIVWKKSGFIWNYDTGFKRFASVKKANYYKEWIQAYLACVAFTDDQLGKVLQSLEDSEYAKNTIVVFTSDHGYQMGQKDYLFKNNLWEEGGHIPFIVYAPNVTKPGGKSATPISLIDVYPTLTDLCGLSSNPNEKGSGLKLDGFSLRPLLVNPEKNIWGGRSVVITSIAGADVLENGEPGETNRQNFSIRSEKYRYILYNNNDEELYDMDNDKYQWKNLAKSAKYKTIKADLRKQLFDITHFNP
jgi:arylsulfatase A-like enzyme